jgi:hypothetical protein
VEELAEACDKRTESVGEDTEEAPEAPTPLVVRSDASTTDMGGPWDASDFLSDVHTQLFAWQKEWNAREALSAGFASELRLVFKVMEKIDAERKPSPRAR